MAYVATVNLMSGGSYTGTSLKSDESAVVLTGSLTVTVPDGFTEQYKDGAGTTARVPKGNVRSMSVT